MSGNFVHLQSYFVLEAKWGSDWRNMIYKIRKDYLNTKDTFLIILSNGQQQYKEAFESQAKDNGINILYKSPVAINSSPHHGTQPRNTLYVFEYDGS